MVWLRKNWFILGIVVALLTGFLLADRAETLNPSGWTNRLVVFLLFLITGLTLPSDRIRQDLSNPRLHILIQTFIFVVAPALFLTASPLFRDAMDGQLLVGIFALAVLPTTVSSCIVFAQSANGNTVGAVFNASLANTVGILLSPLLLSLFLSGAGRALPVQQLLSTLRSLAMNMLVPIVVGQVVRIKVRDFVDRHRKKFGVISNSLILVVVVLAFAKTASNPQLTRYATELPWVFVYLAVVHLILVGLVLLSTRLLKFSTPDRITAMFVAPQKTLALGAPLLTIYFSGQEILGVALLPLLFYHPFQLLIAGFLKGLPFVRAAGEHGASS
jgi:solute carrier family 10 (sodium/bile acid cotransporter), member 7